MKNYIQVITLFFSIVLFPLFPESFSSYQLNLVKKFPYGNGKEQLGYGENISPTDFNGPYSFAFDKIGNLYICDTWNKRIQVLTKDILFLRDISSLSLRKTHILGSRYLNVVDTGDVIGSNDEHAFSQVTSTGDIIFNIDFISTIFQNKLKRNSFFIDQNSVFTHLTDGSVIGIENPGPDDQENKTRILDPDKTLKVLESKRKMLDKKNEATERFNAALEGRDLMSQVNGETLVEKDNEPLTSDYQTFIEYFDGLHQVLPQIPEKDRVKVERRLEKLLNKPKIKKQFSEDIIKKGASDLIGRDKDGNYYWFTCFKVPLLVFTKGGWLLDAFKIEGMDNVPLHVQPAVHPRGDVYFMFTKEDGVYLYKVARQW